MNAPNPPFNLARHCLAKETPAQRAKTALCVVADAAEPPAEIWNYDALERAVLNVCGALQKSGLERGDRLLIRLDNTSAYPIVFLGAIAAGLIPIPASTQLTDAEAEFLIEDSGATALAARRAAGSKKVRFHFDADDVARMIANGPPAPYADTRAEDPAYIIYTSGTTARPKGVVHAQRVILGRAPMYQGWYAITAADRVLHAGAFNWTYTLGTGLLDPWANGATSLIFTGEKTPTVWPELIRTTGATIFAAVPSLIRQILKYAPEGPIDLGHLRHALIAGERPPEDLFDAWANRTGTALHEALGMSELSTYISTAPGIERPAGATGYAQPGRRIAILSESDDDGDEPLPPGEPGLIAVHRSDPGLMLGYWNRPNEESEVYRGQWFVGGDIGVMDANGAITHLGRANDIMKALGYRVAPQEVEATLAEFPGVSEVACAEIKVRSDVSVIAAFIVPRPGAAIDAGSVKVFAAARLAAYKCPKEVVFVEALPRTANGKVRRSELAARYAAAAGAST